MRTCVEVEKRCIYGNRHALCRGEEQFVGDGFPGNISRSGRGAPELQLIPLSLQNFLEMPN